MEFTKYTGSGWVPSPSAMVQRGKEIGGFLSLSPSLSVPLSLSLSPHEGGGWLSHRVKLEDIESKDGAPLRDPDGADGFCPCPGKVG